MLKVCISPTTDQIRDDNGVGQVVHAQYRYLPDLGIELTGPDNADVIACHIVQGAMPRVDVLHCHGLYWDDIPHAPYETWHHEANGLIIAAARQAYAITVPSQWVAAPFQRDMRLAPEVIGHGIDLDDWPPAENKGYVLWNKNRAGDVCDPTPAYLLAARGVSVVSTFAPYGMPAQPNLTTVGPQSHEAMRKLVRHAHAYLATTRETFGIGTLEALAAGVPVIGYAYGGTADIVEHEVSGYLVAPGDVDGLMAGLAWLSEHPKARAAARERATCYSWRAVCERYAALYERVAEQKASERRGVSVVITNYNYGGYVNEAIESAAAQSLPVEEIIVVDDGSTDDSASVLTRWERTPGVTVLRQSNQGVAGARNVGIAHAGGSYIVCLDADDRLHPDYCRVLAQALDRDRGLGIAYSGLGLIQADGSVAPNAWPPAFDWQAQTTPANPPSNCIPCAAMFRRTLWERAGGYKQVYAPAEDTEFFTRGLSIGFTARKVVDEPLFEYRIHSGSASRTKEYKPIDLWHPWMRDRRYPMAAPSEKPPGVRSYADPLISVVIPCGQGHEQHLPTAIESLLGQTFRQWECIIADDTATHALILAQSTTLRTSPFVRLVFTDGQQGPGAARNAGLAAARAPLVLFLDADDYLLPEALSTMLRAYADSGGKYVYSDWFAMRGGELEAHQCDDYSQTGWLERGVHAVTALLETDKARAVGGFDEQMRGWEDWDFFLKFAVAGYCGVRAPAPLLVYRQDTGTVRERSLANKDELLAALKDRYGAYAWGNEQMSACCGGNADTILAAKAALAKANGPADAWLPPPATDANSEAPIVRLRFTGPNRGGITYRGKATGRSYIGGDNALEKYADVDPKDAPGLVNLGVWEYVQQPTAAPPPPVAAPIVVAAQPPVEQPNSRPMRDLAGDMPAELDTVVNQETRRVRREMRQRD